jgi:PAS domain S-box-containing protein
MNYKTRFRELEKKYVLLQNELASVYSREGKELSPDSISGAVFDEILTTVSSYLALFSRKEDGRFYITGLNSKVEETELIDKDEVAGKPVESTPLSEKPRLLELLNLIHQSGEAQKLSVSPMNDDSEGFYLGFSISPGYIIVTWEPGENQKKNAEIRRSRFEFENFADMLPEMIYELDLTGKLVFANTQALRFGGYTAEEMRKGLHISQFFPEHYKKMLENLAAIRNHEDISSNEYYIRKKDGTTVPIVTHSFAIFHEDKIIGYRGTVTDISKRKKYEEQITREKAFLEHLIDSTPLAIVISDVPGKITMVNKEFTNLFGYTSAEAINRNINDLVVPDEFREEAESIDKLAAARHRVIRETIRKDKSGNRIQVSLTSTAIVVNYEPAAFVGIYRDITTEKKNALQQEVLYNISSAALQQTDLEELYPTIERELGKIWSTNNFYIALYDSKTETLTMPFFADEKDTFREVSAHKTITGWVIRNKKSVLLKEKDLAELEEAGEIELIGTQCKVWMGVPLQVDNDVIGVICLQDYYDEDRFSPDDLYVLDFIANQTAIALQRRIMLDNLITARQKAEEAAQSKQIFMSTMSHEIRTPLNEVIGITNLLLQGNPRDDQMDYIKTLRFSGNHLLTLVNDVLDYNKMESGKIVFEQIRFNLNDFLDEIMRSYSFRSKAKNLDFDIVKVGSLPVNVIGDQIRLNQILSNLLSNALKFTKEGGISVIIREVERNNSQSKLEFSVRDSGIGIPFKKQAAIFENYAQASSDTTRRYGGTGLGLAICKKLVELQGGTIGVQSDPGKGSTFSFTLSFEDVTDGDARDEEIQVSETYTGLEGKKILVAEDNKINFFVVNKFLSGWGVIVAHAEDGQLAIEKLENEDFDLILMDLHMPIMDGIEATQVIRSSEDPRIRDIPIVALTAAIMSENHDRLDQLNINDYVLKPFKPHDLFERIRKHIR